MQDPRAEIANIVKTITTANTPSKQRDTFLRYFTHDVAFRHNICNVPSSNHSREVLLGVYQWYRVISPKIELEVLDVTYNEEKGFLILDVEQKFHLFFSIFSPAPSRLVVKVSLRKVDGLYYIRMQEDFYHHEDFAALVLPPLIPVIRFVLDTSGYGSAIGARIAQALGIWRPSKKDDVIDKLL